MTAVQSAELIEGFFAGWQETIIWSCLQGVMGRIYADDMSCPKRAAAVLGDFCFLVGEADGDFAASCASAMKRHYCILVPQNLKWENAIERAFGSRAERLTRYGTVKETSFDREKLREIAGLLPGKYELREIDESLFGVCKRNAWSRDLVSNFDSFEDYRNMGLGVVVLYQGEIVSGASSYSAYRGGIEVEIDTREDFRRKGLAAVCGAQLILNCLKRGIYPSWDAHNRESLALAEKLGYAFSHSYTAYGVSAR